LHTLRQNTVLHSVFVHDTTANVAHLATAKLLQEGAKAQRMVLVARTPYLEFVVLERYMLENFLYVVVAVDA